MCAAVVARVVYFARHGLRSTWQEFLNGLTASWPFALYQGWTEDSTVGDQHWHSMVKLHVSEEATWLHDFVEDSLDRFRRKTTETVAGRGSGGGRGGDGGKGYFGSGGAETQFMCAHVRRQDFEESCARYDEEYRTGRYAV